MPLCKIHHGFLQTVQLLLALIIIGSLLSWTSLAAEESNNPISIEGQVQVPQGITLSEGLDVVLIKFVLDPSGEVVPAGPVGRTKTDDTGRFRFEDPPGMTEPDTVWELDLKGTSIAPRCSSCVRNNN